VPSENIIIRNCRFKGLHGVVIGSEMSAGVRNVFVEDCTSGGYCKRALFVKTNPNRGGFVHDIYFRNCEFDEVEDFFYITSMYAGEGADDNHFTDVHDIHVEDTRCNKVRKAAIVLQGTEAKPLRGISFRNVVVKACEVGFSSMNTEPVVLQNCHLGGEVTSAPTQVTKQDKIFER
jgi:polygalacturonase